MLRMSDIFSPGENLYGSCGGYLGRHVYGKVRVEAVGLDWMIVRTEKDEPIAMTLAKGDLEKIVSVVDEWRKETQDEP